MMTLTQAGAVLAVLALLSGTLWGLRRVRRGAGPGWPVRFGQDRPAVWRITSRLTLTGQHVLHEVETPAGERYVLATHPGGVTLVAAGAGARPLAERAAGQTA